MLKRFFNSGGVEFFCAPEDYGVIAAPYSARKLMPEWYRNLTPHLDGKEKHENSTIKRCAPFLDAMTTGWIIPLAADVVFESNADASGVNYSWSFYKPMVENHGAAQVAGHPESPKPPMKFLNYIFIRIPPKHSALFVPPLNRPDPHFECISGMVDAGYMGDGDLEYINFPFFFKQPNFTGIIKAGTPLVQLMVIPWNDVTFSHNTSWKAATKDDVAIVERTRRRRQSHESHYRNKLWKRRKDR